MDRNLQPGQSSDLVLMLPKSDPDEPNLFVKASGVVSASVLSAMQFHATFDWLDVKENGKILLQERLGKQKLMWSQAG